MRFRFALIAVVASAVYAQATDFTIITVPAYGRTNTSGLIAWESRPVISVWGADVTLSRGDWLLMGATSWGEKKVVEELFPSPAYKDYEIERMNFDVSVGRLVYTAEPVRFFGGGRISISRAPLYEKIARKGYEAYLHEVKNDLDEALITPTAGFTIGRERFFLSASGGVGYRYCWEKGRYHYFTVDDGDLTFITSDYSRSWHQVVAICSVKTRLAVVGPFGISGGAEISTTSKSSDNLFKTRYRYPGPDYEINRYQVGDERWMYVWVGPSIDL